MPYQLVGAFAMVAGHNGPERKSVLGIPVGPFVIYSDADLESRKHCRSFDRYHVTHAATGYSAAKSRSKKQAVSLAKKLISCGADWSFSSPDDVRQWPTAWVEAVRVIRAEGVR